MKKIILTAVFCLFLVSRTLVSAETDEVTDNLKRRLQESLTATDSGSESPLSLRGYIGVVKDIIDTTIILEDKDGKKDVRLAEDANILRSPGNATIKATNINIGDAIIAIGTPEKDDILTGRRLIVSSSAFAAPAKTSSLGVIAKITKSSLTLTIGDKDQIVSINSKTVFKSPAGSIELSDLAVGDTIIYTATLDDDTQTATIVMRIKTTSSDTSEQ